MKPGTVLANGHVVQSVEEYLVERAEAYAEVLIRDQHQILTKPNGAPTKLTRAEWGRYQGLYAATLDALLAVRAGSGYFHDDSYDLRLRFDRRVLARLGLGPEST
jgi:hypothetical protein